MESSRTTICPHECVDPLLERIRINDQEDPPGSPHAEENARRRHLHWPHPSRDQLEHILEVVHAASLQPEEGVTAGFSIAFVSPDGPGRRCDVVVFANPRTFDRRAVAKLAPAVDPDRTFLAVFPGKDGSLQIWGLIHSNLAPLSTELTNKIPTGLRHGSFFAVRAPSPGVFSVYHCCQMHLVYVRGEACWGLSGGRLQSILRDRAGVEPEDAEALCQIAERMVLLGRGGTLLITEPGVEVSPAILDLSCRFDTPSTLLKDSVEAMRNNGYRDLEGRCRAALDFVASLTRIDGVVSVTSDLTVQGFGGKIRLKELQDTKLFQEDASPTFEAKDRTAEPASLSMSAIPGMRHRSAAQFCMQHEGQALAIVVSQDGDVSLFWRQPDGSVLRIGPFALGVGLGVS